MTVERIALGLLIAFAALMGFSVLSAADRFGDSVEVFDEIRFSLGRFEYSDPQSPVELTIQVTNPTSHEVEIVAFETTLSANGFLVGGADVRPGRIVPATSSHSFTLQSSIDSVSYMERLEPNQDIRWLGQGRVLVQANESLDPEWITLRRFAPSATP